MADTQRATAPAGSLDVIEDQELPIAGSAAGGVPPKAVKQSPVQMANQKQDIPLADQTNLLRFKQSLAVFNALSLCALVKCLDSTIVASALPSISAHFTLSGLIGAVVLSTHVHCVPAAM